ncbi:MAG: class II aldolase/adducin family protein [Nocardioidaceae bacterium]
MTEDARTLVGTAARVLGRAGHGDLIWGHASARDDSGRGVWLKAASWGLEEVGPDQVHLVDPGGQVLEGGGQRHSEYPIHTEICQARPDVGGVVHVHSKYAIALAAAGQPLLPVSHAANFFEPHGVPRFTDTADLILTPELGQAVASQLGQASAIFLVNHGVVTVGEDIRVATVAAVLLEMACEQQLLTSGFGGWPTWSQSAESESKRRNIYTAKSVNGVWNYLVRQLEN